MTPGAGCARGIILGATGITNHAWARRPRVLQEDRRATLVLVILLWVMPDGNMVVN
jgi:hypothetical protein